MKAWSQQQLADAANVGLSTVRDLEKGRHMPISNNLAAIQSAFEAAGITFLWGGDLATGPSVSLHIVV
jgi:transcriptional regulator with XRE-family HTH domain